MATNKTADAARPTNGRGPSRARSAPAKVDSAPAKVDSATRVVVGFPLSTIRIDDASNAAYVAELVARLCRLLAETPTADALRALAADSDALAARLRR